MKALFLSLFFLTTSVWAQEPAATFALFDQKVYSLKTKGVKDFVVDISSSKLTEQINDQKTFGTVKKLIFRTYWTANPERIAMEVIGLPEGFREVKEELKISMSSVLEGLLPPTLAQRFAGYKFSKRSMSGEFLATDTSGLASVPSFIIKFDTQDKLTSIVANRPVGSSVTDFLYEKKAFSDGKWVLNTVTTVTTENGVSLTNTRKHDYGSSQGIGILAAVTITTEQKVTKPESRTVSQSDEVVFTNYKINSGEAFKFFLGDNAKSEVP